MPSPCCVQPVGRVHEWVQDVIWWAASEGCALKLGAGLRQRAGDWELKGRRMRLSECEAGWSVTGQECMSFSRQELLADCCHDTCWSSWCACCAAVLPL